MDSTTPVKPMRKTARMVLLCFEKNCLFASTCRLPSSSPFSMAVDSPMDRMGGGKAVEPPFVFKMISERSLLTVPEKTCSFSELKVEVADVEAVEAEPLWRLIFLEGVVDLGNALTGSVEAMDRHVKKTSKKKDWSRMIILRLEFCRCMLMIGKDKKEMWSEF